MRYNYPHTIDNGGGEEITFVAHIKEGEEDYLQVENLVQPNAGPPMHVHFKQEESLTVVKGRLGTQVLGQEPRYYKEGDTATFPAGAAHKFWNAGTDSLICKGWVKPAHNVEYFLTQIYASMRANGGKRPGNFDTAYLLDKYRSEFDMLEVPPFVKKFIFPLTIFFGKLQGRHKKYEDAPPPVV